MKIFDGADGVVRHCVSDHPDKYVSLLWPLLNDKCPGIYGIGRGHEDARGTEKEGGRETRTEGRKNGGRKGGERDKRRGEGEETQPAPLNRHTELSSC